MRAPHLLLVLSICISGCASPLQKLTHRIEQLEMYQWNYEPPTGEELGDLAFRLRWAASYLGVTIAVDPEMTDNELGRWQVDGRVIFFNKKLSLDGQVHTIAHELGHVLQPPGLTEAQRELFAESVAYLTILPIKDEKERFARYMARYRPQARVVLTSYEREIRWAVRFLRMEGTR